jgi:hypothetical protein
MALTACGGGNGGQEPILGGPSITNAGPPSAKVVPLVTSASPAPNALGVPTNLRTVKATFSKPMDASTFTASSFTLACPSGAPITTGAVSYDASKNTAVLTLSSASALPINTQCVATVTPAAKSATGQPLALDYVWRWTTGATADLIPPTVAGSNPAMAAISVCTSKTVNATFSEPMDALSITNTTFTLAATLSNAAVPGVVSYDAATQIASFNPTASLAAATNYTATLKGGASGVKDLAGNAMLVDQTITFDTSATACLTAPTLGAASTFGGFGGNATLTNDGLNTVINGDIGVNASSTKVTGLHDAGGNVYTITPTNNGSVNGTIYTLTAPPGSVAGSVVTKARSDALVAFNSISPASMPGGLDVSSLAQCPSCGGAGQGPGQLAGRTLPPGVYLSTTGTYGIGITAPTAGNLTLDAGGDANAVWVFQTAAGSGTLTVGVTGPATPAVPVQVLLLNGAMAKNVFWYVPGGASIGTGSSMVGTLLSDATITFSTTGGTPPTAVPTRLEGRAIALTAGVTMTNTVVNVPAP